MLKEHPLLPNDEQCDLMDQLVEGLDLDALGEKQHAGANDEQETPAPE